MLYRGEEKTSSQVGAAINHSRISSWITSKQEDLNTENDTSSVGEDLEDWLSVWT